MLQFRMMAAAKILHSSLPSSTYGALIAISRGLRTSALAASTEKGSHMSDNHPELMQKEKEHYLKGETVPRVPEVPGWSEHLASVSEAVIKAEKSNVDIKELQDHTVKVMHAEHAPGPRPKFGPDHTKNSPSLQEQLETSAARASV